MKKIINKNIFLLIVLTFLLIYHVPASSARKIREIKTIHNNNFGTKTYYREISGKRIPYLKIDKNGNVVEEYYYEENDLKYVAIRNLYSGKWINIKIDSEKSTEAKKDGMYSYKFKISTNGWVVSEKILYNYWFLDKELNFVTTILKPFSPRGVGLSFKNWVVKYLNDRYGVKTLGSFNTNNPGILVIAEKLMKPGITYKIEPQSNLEREGYQSLTKKEILTGVGSFRISENDINDNIYYVDGSYINYKGKSVEIGSDGKMHTIWKKLNNKKLEDIQFTDHWRIKLNGEIIGKVSNIGDPDHVIHLKGTPDSPFGMYINKKGNIVQYQNEKIIKIIKNN